jgi:hypothetical protein
MGKYIISIKDVSCDYVDLSFEKEFTAKDDKKAIEKFNKDKIKIQEDCFIGDEIFLIKVIDIHYVEEIQ